MVSKTKEAQFELLSPVFSFVVFDIGDDNSETDMIRRLFGDKQHISVGSNKATLRTGDHLFRCTPGAQESEYTVPWG